MLEPVVAALVAWAWLGETLGAVQLVGAAVVLSAIALSQTRALATYRAKSARSSASFSLRSSSRSPSRPADSARTSGASSTGLKGFVT